jgi:hypothetical protein
MSAKKSPKTEYWGYVKKIRGELSCILQQLP